MLEVAAAVEQALAKTPRPGLLVLDPAVPDPGVTRSRLKQIRLGEPRPRSQAETVVLVVPDVAALRRACSLAGGLGRAETVVCLVLDADAAVPYAPLPGWPAAVSIEARMFDGAALTRVRLAERFRVQEVLGAMARSAAAPVLGGTGGVWVSTASPSRVPPVDLAVRDGYAADDQRPADVLLDETGFNHELEPSVVTGRAPVRVTDAGRPLDEAVYHPVGFGRTWSRPVVDLPAGARLTPRLVADVRDAQGVRVDSGVDPEVAAGLAMSGVPLVDGTEPDLDDPLRREEHSVRLRRAALREHSTIAWHHRIGARAGARAAGYPSVSALLVLDDPASLDHALAQAARQRLDLPGAELELVLGTRHALDAGAVAGALGDLPHTVLELPADVTTGEAMRAAAAASSGQVLLTLAAADWYGPEAVADLLLARRYSGAPVVGMPAEQVYLEASDQTVRRKAASENYGVVVAVGTLMVDRPLLRELGGFRGADRAVEAELLDAARRAGALIYRTQGLSHVVRQSAGDLSDDAISGRVDGFAPSHLMEVS